MSSLQRGPLWLTWIELHPRYPPQHYFAWCLHSTCHNLLTFKLLHSDILLEHHFFSWTMSVVFPSWTHKRSCQMHIELNSCVPPSFTESFNVFIQRRTSRHWGALLADIFGAGVAPKLHPLCLPACPCFLQCSAPLLAFWAGRGDTRDTLPLSSFV